MEKFGVVRLAIAVGRRERAAGSWSVGVEEKSSLWATDVRVRSCSIPELERSGAGEGGLPGHGCGCWSEVQARRRVCAHRQSATVGESACMLPRVPRREVGCRLFPVVLLRCKLEVNAFVALSR